LPARQNTPAEIARSPDGRQRICRAETAARGLREPRRHGSLAGSRITAQQERAGGTGQETAHLGEYPFPAHERARALVYVLPV